VDGGVRVGPRGVGPVAFYGKFLLINFAECPLGRHSAKATLPSALYGTRQNIYIFFIFGPNFFLGPCDSISNSILKFGAILTFFDIFH